MSPNRFQRIVTEEQRKEAANIAGQYRRKLSTIFSADVQGYSRLMGSNEEMTVQTIITYRDLISRVIHYNGGRVVDSPGDNILAEFENPVDAVKSSLEIHRQINERNQELKKQHRMKFRIGLNYGDIIEEEGRLYGDGVNIAARLESLAEGGGICISGTVYEQIKGKIPVKVAYLGAKSVKNINKKVPTYRIEMKQGFAAIKHELKIISAPLIMTAFLYLLYLQHFRYLASDSEILAYLILNPLLLVKAYLPYFAALWLCIIAFVAYVHIRKGVNTLLFRLLKGGTFFCVGYVIFYFSVSYIPSDYSLGIGSGIFSSTHPFVEILADSVNVYAKPNSESDVVLQLNTNSTVRINETIKNKYNIWHQGQFEAENVGWMKSKLPAADDQSEKILLISGLYSFRYIDAASIIFGLLFFIWGFRSGST